MAPARPQDLERSATNPLRRLDIVLGSLLLKLRRRPYAKNRKDFYILLVTVFTKGIPGHLIKAHKPVAGHQGFIERITSTGCKHYLDIAWPGFEGDGGFFQRGFSEKFNRGELNKLWLQMSVLSLVILLIALGGSRKGDAQI